MISHLIELIVLGFLGASSLMITFLMKLFIPLSNICKIAIYFLKPYIAPHVVIYFLICMLVICTICLLLSALFVNHMLTFVYSVFIYYIIPKFYGFITFLKILFTCIFSVFKIALYFCKPFLPPHIVVYFLFFVLVISIIFFILFVLFLNNMFIVMSSVWIYYTIPFFYFIFLKLKTSLIFNFINILYCYSNNLITIGIFYLLNITLFFKILEIWYSILNPYYYFIINSESKYNYTFFNFISNILNTFAVNYLISISVQFSLFLYIFSVFFNLQFVFVLILKILFSSFLFLFFYSILFFVINLNILFFIFKQQYVQFSFPSVYLIVFETTSLISYYKRKLLTSFAAPDR